MRGPAHRFAARRQPGELAPDGHGLGVQLSHPPVAAALDLGAFVQDVPPIPALRALRIDRVASLLNRPRALADCRGPASAARLRLPQPQAPPLAVHIDRAADGPTAQLGMSTMLRQAVRGREPSSASSAMVRRVVGAWVG